MIDSDITWKFTGSGQNAHVLTISGWWKSQIYLPSFTLRVIQEGNQEFRWRHRIIGMEAELKDKSKIKLTFCDSWHAQQGSAGARSHDLHC